MKIPVREVIVSAESNTVHLELVVGDAYEAIVLRDGIVGRLQSGDRLRLSLQGPPQEAEIVRE
jgi:hypothetical protein